MTGTVALVVGYVLFISEVHILFNSNTYDGKYLTSNLIILLNLCLILRKIDLLPSAWRYKIPKICFAVEVVSTIVFLEVFLYYLWECLKASAYRHCDHILTHLAEDRGMDWLICYVCCGVTQCSTTIADLILKCLSFATLLSICWFIGNT